ncbi:hypothetical protein HETIRDRAFT_424395 [Heterobasidion irregulare TC 32-1]|uniref:Dienelactone hydrolase domain-containing protein n=1 Tax=Heterobasidion irregulare (strain TC 32-1) TaxID=747525 RepID=W4KPE6_HETIT|nr:uncharacterized protein HETIRDRAFT_424395 [Heterobasidion irregulare TC 32-1]ETW87682.1 hypothetical protein HETIRDRAFT_424395 [Heterobasidion irregulare TC 32-1]
MLHRLRTITSHLPKAVSTQTVHAIASISSTTGVEYTVHNDNVACCTVPAVQSDYKPQGTIRPYAGFDRAYITGSDSSATALICVFDIFGFKPQTQLGADMLAHALRARVVMPDFFEPSAPWDAARHPPKTDADRAALQAFFGGPARPQDAVPKLARVGAALRADGARRVGAYGLCWGGKVVILAGGAKDTVLDSVAAVHPVMLKVEDTHALRIPLGIYPSKDEPFDEYQKILDIIRVNPFASKNDHKLYETMFHGWAGARANLDDPENKKQFEDIYARLATFFTASIE